MTEPLLNFDEPELLERLAKVAPLQRVRFAYNCAERLLSKAEAPNDAAALATLRGALDQVKLALDGAPPDSEACQRVLAACEALLPAVNETNDVEDQVMATMYVLDCLIGQGEVQAAAWAARHAYEYADFLAQNQLDIDLNSPEAEARFLAFPAVQAELAAQQRDIIELEKS